LDGRRVPETFFLYFNRALVYGIKKAYGVSSEIVRWEALPDRVQSTLRRIGLDANHLPEARKPNFDTFRVIMMLALAEGYRHHYITDLPTAGGSSSTIFHVGGISDPRNVDGMWEFRGSYFWRRLLEASQDRDLKSHYERKYGCETSRGLLAAHPALADEVGSPFLEFCDSLARDATA
jgi:hypothetical protein